MVEEKKESFTYIKTKCDSCKLEWLNKDKRDYSFDRCNSCGRNVIVVGEVTTDVSRGVFKVATREMNLGIE